MAHAGVERVHVGGRNPQLVATLSGPIHRALVGRGTAYEVTVDTVGRVGEILVSVTGFRGRLPLLFSSDELEPGYVFTVVESAVAKYGL